MARRRPYGQRLVARRRRDRATPALDRLLALGRAHGVPLMLAVIPGKAKHHWPNDWPATHPSGGSAWLGPYKSCRPRPGQGRTRRRPADIVYDRARLARGALALDRLFGSALARAWCRPVTALLRPWRAPCRQPAISACRPMAPRRAANPALSIVNTHVDIIDWTPRAFLGESAALDLLIKHLRARRERRVDTDEPTGLLTHHPAHDEGCWSFIDSRCLAGCASIRRSNSAYRGGRHAMTPIVTRPAPCLGLRACAESASCSAGPALAVPTGSGWPFILLPLTAIFAVFAARTFWRQISDIELTQDGLSVANPRPARLAWAQSARCQACAIIRQVATAPAAGCS